MSREVMAVGRCLVLSEELYRKRISDKIKDGKNIIVVDPKNINDFKEKLERVISNSDYAEKIGKRAREVAEEIENFKGYVGSMEQLYQNIIRKKNEKA